MFSCKFCEIFKNTYFIEHFERLLLGQHNMTSENYHSLCETSVFLTRDHRQYPVCEFGCRIYIKIAWMVNVWEGKVSNFTKNDFVYRDFSETSCRTLISTPKQQWRIYLRHLFFTLTLYGLCRFLQLA